MDLQETLTSARTSSQLPPQVFRTKTHMVGDASAKELPIESQRGTAWLSFGAPISNPFTEILLEQILNGWAKTPFQLVFPDKPKPPARFILHSPRRKHRGVQISGGKRWDGDEKRSYGIVVAQLDLSSQLLIACLGTTSAAVVAARMRQESEPRSKARSDEAWFTLETVVSCPSGYLGFARMSRSAFGARLHTRSRPYNCSKRMMGSPQVRLGRRAGMFPDTALVRSRALNSEIPPDHRWSRSPRRTRRPSRRSRALPAWDGSQPRVGEERSKDRLQDLGSEAQKLALRPANS
jgi:hypothetical protein